MLSICYHFSFAAYEHACNLKAFSLRRDEGFIYLLFRRKLMLHCIPHSLPTPSPNESPAKRLSFGKGGTRSSVDVTAQARSHDLMALFGRNKRYNTLDLASKIVCQRQASPALLWKPPGYRQHHFSARERNVFCRYSFSPVCHNNAKSVFVTRMENEKRAFNPSAFCILILRTAISVRVSRLGSIASVTFALTRMQNLTLT